MRTKGPYGHLDALPPPTTLTTRASAGERVLACSREGDRRLTDVDCPPSVPALPARMHRQRRFDRVAAPPSTVCNLLCYLDLVFGARSSQPMMRSSFALAVVATVAALVALLPGANAAYDFTAKPALATLPGCTPAAPGSAAPQVDTSRTNMTKADITMAAWTKPVDGRKMVMYLGKNQVDPDCFAGYVGNTATCRFDFALHGTWQGLRKCGWAAPDTVSRPGYEIRNNTVYIEWQDAFPGGNRQTSRYAYPVSVALTTTVNVQTDVSVLEESGIKNFNLTGLAYETDNGNRYLLLDFSMYSR